jgi:hypothetical protein
MKINKMAAEKSSWTVNKLKIELSKRGAKTTGRKSELVERLESYERNQNFSSDLCLPESDPMPEWPMSGFHSVTQSDQENLPNLTTNHIEQYVLYRQVNHSEANLDNSALKKGSLMSEDSVHAMSIYRQKVNYLCEKFEFSFLKR